MPARETPPFAENNVTDEAFFRQRRQLLAGLGIGALAGAAALPSLLHATSLSHDCNNRLLSTRLPELKPNLWKQITRYNNYYEFSTNKEVIHLLAKELDTRPWKITVEGEVENPFTLDLDDMLALFPQQQRIYPLRCVEGWSMVIPWQGFELCRLLGRARPTSRAKFVEFTSLLRPEQMPGQRTASLAWPYTEGLRIDEAMHPLTFMATGLYGKALPPQNGAPLRLVVPWKYGFKSAKAITHIRLLATRPDTSWNTAATSEYGFYANVNPQVAHPRWSQQRENRIGTLRKIKTRMFNGYADHVAHLYSGMDLNIHY
jgi:sulfoxide reductase catalytic subunit YedY